MIITAAWLILGTLNLLTLLLYALDKRAAQRGEHRIPEVLFHMLSLSGGWLGALLGQRLLRHKTRKWRFQIIFWLTASAHLALVAWLILILNNASLYHA